MNDVVLDTASLRARLPAVPANGAAAVASANGSAPAAAAHAHVLVVKRRLLWRRVTKWVTGPFASEAEAVAEGERVLGEIRRLHGPDEQETYLYSVERLVAPDGDGLPPEFRPYL